MARPSSKESFRDFKIRVIDPISPSYCAAKWYNATIWLGHGQTTSCHRPPPLYIDKAELEANPSALHNTQHKKKMRKLMLDGVKPSECSYCWQLEDMPNTLSDRPYKTHMYSDEDIANTTTIPWDTNVNLRTLEVSFNRTCNFACSYCNSAYSSSWVKDLKKYGPYTNIVTDDRKNFTEIADWAANVTDNDADNPYIQAFWKWWDNGLADSLEELRITGGEPLMSTDVWKLFDWFSTHPESKMRFGINSNLIPKHDIFERLVSQAKTVPHLEIFTSNESVGVHSEYIRDGMEYDHWISNIRALMPIPNVKQIHIMMTINALCLASITEFMDDIIAIKRDHSKRYPMMSLNLLQFPEFQSVSVLPTEVKQLYSDKLQAWLANIEDLDEHIWAESDWYTRIFTNEERDQVRMVIRVLGQPAPLHIDKLQSDFSEFYSQYDIRRNKNFNETFPQHYVELLTKDK